MKYMKNIFRKINNEGLPFNYIIYCKIMLNKINLIIIQMYIVIKY